MAPTEAASASTLAATRYSGAIEAPQEEGEQDHVDHDDDHADSAEVVESPVHRVGRQRPCRRRSLARAPESPACRSSLGMAVLRAPRVRTPELPSGSVRNTTK